MFSALHVSKHEEKKTRDLRIDFFRGLTLIVMFISHVYWSFIYLAWSLWGYSSAFEVFVFISGYLAGMVYSKVYRQVEINIFLKKIWKRIAQIYVAHIVVLVGSFMIVFLTHRSEIGFLENPFVGILRFEFFFQSPFKAIGDFLLLYYQPIYHDILPIYLFMLFFFPLMLVIFHYSWVVGFGISFFVYVMSQMYPEPLFFSEWLYNPLAWQLLFYVGVVLSFNSGVKQFVDRGRRFLLVPALALILLGTMGGLVNFLQHPFFEGRWDPLITIWPFKIVDKIWEYGRESKMNLGPLPIFHLFSLVFVVEFLTRNRENCWRSPLLYPFVLCGQCALQIYVLGMILSLSLTNQIVHADAGLRANFGIAIEFVAMLIGIAIQLFWAWGAHRWRQSKRNQV